MTKKAHPSELNPQRMTEVAIREKLENVFGVALQRRKILLGDGLGLEVAAANPEQRFYGEICAHLGKLQPAHLETVAADILKLQFLEKKIGAQCRKFLGFADVTWVRYFDGKSWLAAAAKTFDVKIVFVSLAEEILLEIFAAQRRQKIV